MVRKRKGYKPAGVNQMGFYRKISKNKYPAKER